MLLTPTEHELQQLAHMVIGYDPVRAHEYYEKHKVLKGRQPGAAKPEPSQRVKGGPQESTKAKQKKELSAHIQSLSKKLNQLEELIRKKEAEARGSDTKSKAKKERAAKEKDKPKTAAEKAKAARESKKYADSHKQELKTKAKEASTKSGGGDSSKTKKAGAKSVSLADLKSLATKVKGQIAVAKQKLAAL